jgi:glycosyltransferase involved in cell wall biosynthesis
VGRFDEIKNLPMLVQSLAGACTRVPQLRGLLVGDGPVFDAVRSQVARAGLEERVRLTGYRPDARRLSQCLDLFVLASFSEGTSMALLEAMSAGVPVAVTAVGGNPEIVSDGETGWLVPSGAGALLSQVLVEAATDPEKCARLGSAGRRMVAERYTFPRMLQAYRECYRALLQGGT